MLERAADCNLLPSNDTPRILYRFSRLTCPAPPSPSTNGIPETYRAIEDLGIDLQFGDPYAEDELPVTGTIPPLCPTTDVNLDLSLLIALISDISHAPLPTNDQEAAQRFHALPRPWKITEAIRVNDDDRQSTLGSLPDKGAVQHVRALGEQLNQEMHNQLVLELTEALGTATCDSSVVRFYTTREAMERCREIIRKIAGPGEAARAAVMFADPQEDQTAPPPPTLESDAFWLGSRHQGIQGPLAHFKVHILDDKPMTTCQSHHAHSFASRLVRTCHRLLDPKDQPTQSSTSSYTPEQRRRINKGKSPLTRSALKLQTNGSPHNSTPIKVPSSHTIRSMLMGAQHGMTTITANRMSVKQIIRNMSGLQGLSSRADLQDSSGLMDADSATAAAFMVVDPKTLAEQKRLDCPRAQSLPRDAHVAVLWTTNPRSLAETMKSE